MKLLDSSGWIEYFKDGKNAALFGKLVIGQEPLLVPTICLLEVERYVRRTRGEVEARETVALMRRGEIAPLDEETASMAARLGLEHKLALADSVFLATARRHRATVWTQDVDFKGLLDVHYIAA